MADLDRQTILVVDDHDAVRKQLYWALEENYRVLEAASRSEALAHLERENIDVVLCDLHLPPLVNEVTEGIAVLEAARQFNPPLPVIVLTGSRERAVAVQVTARGAYGFFQKDSFSLDEVEIIVRQAAEKIKLEREKVTLEQENASLRKQVGEGWQEVIGSNAKLQAIFAQAREVASTSATVLITGESGTGKEVLARAIHRSSPRANKPFVACSIAALPETLIESELFGHEKGAFTGAVARKAGRFEQADGGTLFLDEIGELSHTMQVKLLRVLQERQFERLGGKEQLNVDIRVVAATNRNLEEMIGRGEFRADLYYRLNVVSLELPPLRERPDDIPLLATHFARKAASKHERPVPSFTADMIEALCSFAWPGNIRELENVIERCVVISTATVLDVNILPERIRGKILAARAAATPVAETSLPVASVNPVPPTSAQTELTELFHQPEFSYENAITDFKRQLVRTALRECNGSRSEAASRLKIARQYLYRLINELQISEEKS
ncbi:MAG: sigma-54-dependent Fis family transcriptional regulator [Acidobacteria bacterium]|nr:sigma-54-dependent Fis family transcriptional regulator [Acidobacteriota bacterium]